MQYSEAALQQVREDRLLIDEVDNWLYDEIAPYIGDRVLELGCGVGNFAGHFIDRSLYIGIEPDPESVLEVEQRYAGHENVKAFVADATDPRFAQQYSEYEFDTVFSLNVFEHIEDHRRALQNAFDVVQPGGNMILIVPAHGWLYGSIDKAIGHYRRYDKRMLRAFFEDVGFTVEHQKYINAVGALGWWVNARLRGEDVPPAGQLKTFNRIVPALKAVERLAPPPFGISVMCVGKRPALVR